MRRIFLAVIGLVVLLGAAAYGYRHFVLLPGARAPILAGLNDPDSATFQSERFVGPWALRGSTYCAQMNAKNRMGGYAGYSPVMSSDGEKEFNTVYRDIPEFCDKAAAAVPWWWLRW